MTGNDHDHENENETAESAQTPTTAVLDRIVDGQTAVLLLEGDDHVVDQLDVEVDRLPEEGRHEGAVFDLVVEEGEDALEDVRYRPEETDARRDAAQERLDRLSERLSDE